VAALLLLLPAACGTGWNPPAIGPDRGARVLTAGEIRHLGAANAWEVLEQTGIHMPVAPSSLVPQAQARREYASAPRVMVDGVPMVELRLLRDIPASVISSVRIFSSVVVIRTHD
jgi:hypothetical protein